MKKLFTTTLLLLLLQACSDDDAYDKKKAILAFANSNSLKIDKNLKKTNIKIPKQQKNSLYPTQNIENFSFTPLNKKKFLNKSSRKWTGYRPILSYRLVFTPIFTKDKVFLLDAKGILWAYDLKTGKKIFKNRLFNKKYLKNYQNPKIGLFGDKIFAIAGNNEIKAASAINGELIWSKKILSLAISTPISDGKLVFVTTSDDKTYALKTHNGELSWVSSGVAKPTSILGAAKPIIHKNKLIVSYASGEIYALNKENGELIWSQSLNINRATSSDFYLNDIDATPIIKGERIFAIGNGGLMMAINSKNGEYFWKKELASISDFWASAGYLFIINNDDKLICLSQRSGAIKYISQLPHFRKKKKPQSKIIYNGIVMAGGKLLISDQHGRILVAEPQNGKIEQTFKIKQEISHAPIVINNKIYFHSLGRFTANLIEIR